MVLFCYLGFQTETKKDIIVVNQHNKIITELRYGENGKLETRLSRTFDSTGTRSLKRRIERWHPVIGYSAETATYEYDDNGYMIKITDRNKNNQIIRETFLKNNDNGHLIELKLTTGNSNSYGTEIAEYDYLNNKVITKAERIEFKIKQIKSFDGEGNLESIEIFNESGELEKIFNREKEIQKEFLYNNENLLFKEIRYNSNEKIHNSIKHYYNSENQLVKKELTNSSGKINAFWTFEYNEKNQLIKEIQKSETATNSTTEYKYKNSELIETQVNNKTIGKESKTTFKYNELGFISTKKTTYYFGNSTMTWKYSYNEKGKLISLVDKSSNGMKSTTTYQYDKNSLLIKESWRGTFSKEDLITNYTFE